jgi:transposase-like protein
MIISGGKRKPAKLDLDTDTRRQRRRINQACLILFAIDATAPVEELLAERGIVVDHVTVYRWVQRSPRC